MEHSMKESPPAPPAGLEPQQEQSPSPKKHPWGHRRERERYPVKDPVTYTDHEKRYPPDKFGHEADDDARVWRLYKAGAADKEDDRVNKLRKTIDSLPVFAGLFSAVQTAFIIEGAKKLEPDFTEYQTRAFFAVHRANNSGFSGLGGSFDPDAFIAPTGARWANGLWLGGLVLSLFVALHAIIAQQWLEDYSFRINEPAPSHRRWVWRHLVFSAGFEQWKIDAIISALPLLLHLSLLMFIIGLVLFLVPIDTVAALVIVGAAGAGFVIYLVVTFIPVVWRDCPTATPLLRLVLYIYHLIARRFGPDGQTIHDAEKGDQDGTGYGPKDQGGSQSDEQILISRRRAFDLDIDALRWMIKYLPTVDDVNAALDAVSSLSPHEDDLSVISPERSGRFAEINRALDGRVDALSSGIAAAEPAAIARVLRTSVAMAAINRKLGLHSPVRKYMSQIHSWMTSVPQYDVFWLCQILVSLDARPGDGVDYTTDVATWYLDGKLLDVDHPCLSSTHSLLLDWHFAGSVQKITAEADTTMLPILRTFCCIEAVHSVTQGVSQIRMQTIKRLLSLCWPKDGSESLELIQLNETARALAHATDMSLLTILPCIMPDQQLQLFRLCSDILHQLPLEPLASLQSVELGRLLTLARQAYSIGDDTQARMSKQVLQFLEDLFSRNLVTMDNWTAEIGALLGRALSSTPRMRYGPDTASLLARLPVVKQPDGSSRAAVMQNPDVLSLLKPDTQFSTWRAIITAADYAFPSPTCCPEALALLALSLVSALLPGNDLSHPTASEDRILPLSTTRALKELLGTPEDMLPFKILLRTNQTRLIVQIVRHAKDLDEDWYSQFVDGLEGIGDPWLEFHGNNIFDRV